MTVPGGFGVVAHRSLIEAFATATPAAVLAMDDADNDAYTVLIPMAGYTHAYRRLGQVLNGGDLLDTLLDIGVSMDAPLDRTAARGAALTAVQNENDDDALTDAETAWHARARGWPVLATRPAHDRLSTAFPDLRVVVID